MPANRQAILPGNCHCLMTIKNNLIARLPTLPTLAAPRPAPSPPVVSYHASPRITHGRIWILPAPPGLAAARTRAQPVVRFLCWCSTCWNVTRENRLLRQSRTPAANAAGAGVPVGTAFVAGADAMLD